MVEVTLGRQMMHHNPTYCSEIMDNLECIQLIRDVLCRAKIRYEIVFVFLFVRHVVVVKIERDGTGAAVDVDRRIIKTEPSPKLSRHRSVGSEFLLNAIEVWRRIGEGN